MISQEEYIQLQSFSRYDGALTAAIWTSSFALYVIGISNPLLMMVGVALGVYSPFFVARRLHRFRDGARGGTISFRRAYAYSVSVFCHAALLFAVAQYVYFAFIDNGYIANCVAQVFSDPQMQQTIKASGMDKTLESSLEAMRMVRPIDYALNNLTLNIALGLLLALPIAGAMQRSGRQLP